MLKINYSILWLAKLLLVCALSLALTTCGYRLSGNTPSQGKLFNPILKNISLQGLKRYNPLRKTIKKHLQSYQIKVTSPTAQTADIIITDLSVSDKNMVIGDYARSRERLLVLIATFNLRYDGQLIMQEHQLRAEDTYLYQSNNPQYNESERKKLLKVLYQTIAQLLVDRLTAVSYIYKGRTNE